MKMFCIDPRHRRCRGDNFCFGLDRIGLDSHDTSPLKIEGCAGAQEFARAPKNIPIPNIVYPQIRTYEQKSSLESELEHIRVSKF